MLKRLGSNKEVVAETDEAYFEAKKNSSIRKVKNIRETFGRIIRLNFGKKAYFYLFFSHIG